MSAPTLDDPASLEKKYKVSQIRAAWAQVWATGAQVIGVVAALATALVAIYVARQGQATVNHDNQSALQQSEDAQLSTAITAIGSNSMSERVAGLVLLERNTESRFALDAKTGEGPLQLFDDYTTALQTYSAYLSSQSEQLVESAAKSQPDSPFYQGYGVLAALPPIDLQYAVDQVRALLRYRLRREVTSERAGQPSIDLSHDELSESTFSGTNFSWIYAYMAGIDLRGATLSDTHFGRGSNLKGAYLQCADLYRANFRGANLTGSDLSGAYVQGANFSHANLSGAKILYVYGAATWPDGFTVTSQPEQAYGLKTCMGNSKLWT